MTTDTRRSSHLSEDFAAMNANVSKTFRAHRVRCKTACTPCFQSLSREQVCQKIETSVGCTSALALGTGPSFRPQASRKRQTWMLKGFIVLHCGHAPIGSSETAYHVQLSVAEITMSVFQPVSMSGHVRSPPREIHGVFVSCTRVLWCRRMMTPRWPPSQHSAPSSFLTGRRRASGQELLPASGDGAWKRLGIIVSRPCARRTQAFSHNTHLRGRLRRVKRNDSPAFETNTGPRFLVSATIDHDIGRQEPVRLRDER